MVDVVFRKARRAARALRDHLVPPPLNEDVIAGRLDGMTSSISRCKSQLMLLLKEERELQLKVHRNANQITHHLRESRLCAHRGEHADAVEHLRVKARYEQVAVTLTRQLHDFRTQIERLMDQIRGVEMVVEDAHRRKSLLVAQRECIQAHLLMGGAPVGPGGPGATTMGELMEDMQSEVATLEEVARITAGTGSGLPSPAEVLLSEEILRSRIDEELEKIKAQVAEVPVERPCEAPVDSDDEILFITG